MSTSAADFDKSILVPALEWFKGLAPKIPISRNCHVILLAIAGQESNWTERLQKPVPFAKSFWQFEKNGGVKGVLTHPATQNIAKVLCANYGVEPMPLAVWNVFGTPEGDNLAAGFSRLLLWSDPKAIPADENGAYQMYLRNWRPGAPSALRWNKVYPQANKAVAA